MASRATPYKEAPSLSVVVPTSRAGADLDRCLASLAGQEWLELEVIVVDNASGEPALPTRFPSLRVIANPENLGFVGACNQGIEASTGELVLLLNDDTVLEDGALRALVETLEENTSWGAAQAKLLRMDDPSLLDTAGSFLTSTGFLVHRGSGEPERNFADSDEIFAAKGAALLVRRTALDDVGSFDPDYFAYFEETDLCWRLWLAGWEVGFAADARVLHTLGATASGLAQPFVQFHSFKNRICTLAKNLGPARLAWMLPYHLALCLLLAGWFALHRKPALGGAIVRAIGWNVKGLPHTLEKRRQVQHRRRVSDRQLMSRITRPTSLRTLRSYARTTG